MSDSGAVDAAAFLRRAQDLLLRRGGDIDQTEERSGVQVAMAFSAITGKNIAPSEVYLLLQILKDVRQWAKADGVHMDSAEDCVAYAALKAEQLVSDNMPDGWLSDVDMQFASGDVLPEPDVDIERRLVAGHRFYNVREEWLVKLFGLAGISKAQGELVIKFMREGIRNA